MSNSSKEQEILIILLQSKLENNPIFRNHNKDLSAINTPYSFRLFNLFDIFYLEDHSTWHLDLVDVLELWYLCIPIDDDEEVEALKTYYGYFRLNEDEQNLEFLTFKEFDELYNVKIINTSFNTRETRQY